MSPFFAWNLIGFLLVRAAAPPVVPKAPPWLDRCLPQLRQSALVQGSPLPIDGPKSADYGTCAARCDDRCFLLGDFDGDGRRELAVAAPSELLLFHDVERKRDRRYVATPAGRLPLFGAFCAMASPRSLCCRRPNGWPWG